MRLIVIPLVIAVVLLVIALVLPSRHDKNFAGWWTRVRYQANFFARVALVVGALAVLLWYVVLPLMGWSFGSFGWFGPFGSMGSFGSFGSFESFGSFQSTRTPEPPNHHVHDPRSVVSLRTLRRHVHEWRQEDRAAGARRDTGDGLLQERQAADRHLRINDADLPRHLHI